MSTLSKSTLAQIVTNDYRTASVFEKYQLDYCCRGKRSLEKACEDSGIEVEKLLAELQSVSQVTNEACELKSWQQGHKILPGRLADHIEQTHHQYVKKEIPIISGFLQKIAIKHGERHPELISVQNHFLNLSSELLKHLAKEETILFPAIREMENKQKNGQEPSAEEKKWVTGPIRLMEMEHEDAGDEMEMIRTLTNDYTPPDDACTSYKIAFKSLHDFEKDLHQHVHLENNVLFPALLSE
ncbi:MAG: iron-sulfur cluster repair di-iron protein [Chitinophagaceae bacterium]|nr:iron-sulfur cluster repair di-iron protein [Chitinophagaceae bacterium]